MSFTEMTEFLSVDFFSETLFHYSQQNVRRDWQMLKCAVSLPWILCLDLHSLCKPVFYGNLVSFGRKLCRNMGTTRLLAAKYTLAWHL